MNGKKGRERPRLTLDHSIKDTGDTKYLILLILNSPPKDMYEEVGDSGRGASCI